MDKNKITKIFARLTKAIPEPKTELHYTSDFELLIAVMLSAHSTDVSVNRTTDALFKVANTPQGILDLGESKLKKYIKNVGLYNTKAANIIKTCKIIVKKHHSKDHADRLLANIFLEYGTNRPERFGNSARLGIHDCCERRSQQRRKPKCDGYRESLEELPGVGRKTANVILNIVFGLPTIAVDTHIFRVSNRTKIAQGKTPLAIEEQLLKVVPQKYLKNAHHLLLLHGRYICKARAPLCKECIISDLCEYELKIL